MISGCVGPPDDGYDPAELLSRRGGRGLPRRPRSQTFADTAADMVTAITMTYADEAIGITRAPRALGLPVVDLVHGRDRRPAAERPGAGRSDRAGRRRTGGAPAYYMINCAHPTHFEARARRRRAWRERDPRPARQRVDAQPRGARRGDRARRGRSRRPRRSLRRAAPPAAAAERRRRLLRHRPPPRGGDRRRLVRQRLAQPDQSGGAGASCLTRAAASSGSMGGSGATCVRARGSGAGSRRCQLSSRTKMTPPRRRRG